ncbi:DUF4955 domain-containing protein [Reichenbachiella carrageenanivorans]|uniref:DUF4955 domain-containing protein n=1 Tax=Reichenbachiella carrageenanivorans TaxID=2979869 RepID=A0ABY6CYR2_9BACT|nr:DUF4955 domain-containing protein [Reichenbachiella carrageenanivorans]UXX79062.1 DUF4955 domain-containing protein [Reichenbachiella carrageenanivorans]
MKDKNQHAMKYALLVILGVTLYTTCQHPPSPNAKIYDDFVNDPIKSQLQDFSYAGYGYGEKTILEDRSLINVNHFGIMPNTGEDLTIPVQALLDSIGQAGGGVVFFPKGRYAFNMDTSQVQFLTIDYDHIVIRGEGTDENGTILYSGSNTVQLDESPWISPFMIRTGYQIQGTKKMWGFKSRKIDQSALAEAKAKTNQDGTIYEAEAIASFAKEAKKGDTVIYLDQTIDVRPGDFLLLGMYNTSEDGNLIKDLLSPMDSFESYMGAALQAGPEQAASYQVLVEVKAADAENRIELVQPLRRDMPMIYEPVVAMAPMLTGIGIENVRFESGWDGEFCHHGCEDSDKRESRIMDYGWNAINMARVAHGWVKNVCIKNFTNAIYLQDSRNVTISEVTLRGYNGHAGIKLYGHSEDNLIENITINTHFRHILSGEGNGYGNVFRYVTYELKDEDGDGEAQIDFHGFSDRFFSPMGYNLFENIKGIHAIRGSGAQHNLPNASRGNVFWNIEASPTGQYAEIIQYYKNYKEGKEIKSDHYKYYPGSIVVGFYGEGKQFVIEGSPADRTDEGVYVESLNTGKVQPESLYQAQLEYRLKQR